MIGGLPEFPGAAKLLGFVLEVAAGHVEADRIAEDMVESLLDRNVASALGQRHHHLNLEMVVPGFRWIGMICRFTFHDGLESVRRFHEEEGWLAGWIATHLPRMGRIVAADAIDTADREHVGAAGNGEGGNRRR